MQYAEIKSIAVHVSIQANGVIQKSLDVQCTCTCAYMGSVSLLPVPVPMPIYHDSVQPQ